MHTSSLLQATDFCFRLTNHGGSATVGFPDLFPDYHELDRVGVVSLRPEDGIRGAGGTLLALTTAFYDAHRSRVAEFFNYPHHFALLGIESEAAELVPRDSSVGRALGNLDVWPESNWIAAPATADGMLRKLFDLQINRLFWPEELLPHEPATRLPNHVRRILGSRLKAVYHYNSEVPTMDVECAPKAARLIHQSLCQLSPEIEPGPDDLPRIERFRE